MSSEQLVLRPGKFYQAKDGEIWCCYRVRDNAAEHCKADCIRVSDSRVEYFFLDGRYDSAGKREHTLVKEVEL